MNNFKFSSSSEKNMKGVDSRLIEIAHEALCNSPIDFGVPQFGGLRTSKDQQELFNRVPKVTNADGVKIKSYHQSGKALDIYAFVNGKASWDELHLALIAGVVLSTANRLGYKVTWGGTFGSKEFKGWDKPHFQIED
jgi:peptidoglycan L-alanyl-D-glutamate endopeptidase CwlK